MCHKKTIKVANTDGFDYTVYEFCLKIQGIDVFYFVAYVDDAFDSLCWYDDECGYCLWVCDTADYCSSLYCQRRMIY